MNVSDAVILLRDGLTVPVAALHLAIELEGRGVLLAVEGDTLVAAPKQKLTNDDRVSIRRWREDLKAVVRYCERDRIH